MERRGFVRMSGAMGVGLLGGGAGCLPGLMQMKISDAEMKDILGEMDRGIDQVSRYDMLDDFSRRSGRPARYSDDERHLAQASVRALYTSASFRSLPEEAQLHPEVQDRVLGQLTEMDEAVFGTAARMASLPAEQRAEVSRSLDGEPALANDIGEHFDRGMGHLRMPFGRRLQVRSMFRQVGWRMQKQPSIAIDEYVTKVTKAASQVGSQVELQRRIAARIGNEAYWRHQNRLAMMLADEPPPGGGGPVGAPGPGGAPVPARAPIVAGEPTAEQQARILTSNARVAARAQQCDAVKFFGNRVAELSPDVYRMEFVVDPDIVGCFAILRQQQLQNAPSMTEPACESAQSLANALARKKVIGTGGWMLGIGVISGLVGGLAIGAGGEGAAVIGALGLTLGGVLLIGGIIVMAVGGGMAKS